MIVKDVIIQGQRVRLFSRDGKNFSSDEHDLTRMEGEAADPESPFWDDGKPKDDADLLTYTPFE